MNDVEQIPTADLIKELEKRTDKPIKSCLTCRGKWTTCEGCSRSWQRETHCFGCRKPVENCTC